jgi:hypothetical protein
MAAVPAIVVAVAVKNLAVSDSQNGLCDTRTARTRDISDSSPRSERDVSQYSSLPETPCPPPHAEALPDPRDGRCCCCCCCGEPVPRRR